MNKKELEAFAKEVAKSLKTEKDVSDFSPMLKKVTIEAALNAELDDHLGYDKHQSNSRNGYSGKTLHNHYDTVDIDVPRDRDNSFEPQLVKKQQPRFKGMDEKILFLYAKGMTTREITATFEELYAIEVSVSLISKVTDSVMEEVIQCQSRPLDAVYPIVYLDCMSLRFVKTNRSSIKRFI